MLIKHGADIEDTQKFDGGASEETPLIFHSRARAISVVKVLLDAGANVNAAGQGGCTALDQADQNNDKAMIALIESHGGKRGCSVMRHLLGPILRKIYEGPH